MRIATTLLFSLFLPALLFAQSNPGAIKGKISNEQDQPLIGITVMIQELDKGTASDTAGVFRFSDIPEGRYTIQFSGIGFKTYESTIAVTPGRTTELDVTLSDNISELGKIVVKAESEADIMEKSAQAVEVVRLSQQSLKTADLGEVLTQTKGVSVRRSGGLGSDTRFSLNGLTDDQIRFFMDGVPLEYAGFPFGIANVPVNLIERVEIYKGVVPVRFGSDALGGAVNLVTPKGHNGTHGSASYQVGSYGMHRAAMNAEYRNEDTGLYVRGSGFYDRTANDYTVTVEVPSTDPETRGQSVEAKRDRFNDAYRATGGRIEFGVVDKSWASHLMVRAFVSDYRNELQSNRTMTKPYGEVEFGGRTYGGAFRYKNDLLKQFSLKLTGGYTYGDTDFRDLATCIYNWSGECVRERQQRGEINPGNPRDETLFERVGFGRLNLKWIGIDNHTIRFSIAPTYVTRDGEDRIRTSDDVAAPIEADRSLFTLVNGIEYEVNLFDDRLENIAFVKSYFQDIRSEDPMPGGGTRSLSRNQVHFGGGNMLRYRFSKQFQAKFSYEYATRLPRAQEIFGDPIDTNPNLELQPEVSHNVNIGFKGNLNTSIGRWQTEVTGFLRVADNLILELPAFGQRFRNENVFKARSTGIEVSTRWASIDDFLTISGNTTYLDIRNLSESGPLAPFKGDRIPNRPYFFANGSASFQLDNVLPIGNRLSLEWNTHFVKDFFQFWESAGTRESKRVIPDQLLHSTAMVYRINRTGYSISVTAEISNLANARAYDFYGAQKPGRAFNLKLTTQF